MNKNNGTIKKQTRKELYRTGNFLYGEDKSASGREFLWVRSISSNWMVRYSADTMLYLHLRMMLDDVESYGKYLDMFALNLYMHCTAIPDAQYFEETMKSFSELSERMKDYQTELTEEEDSQVIKEMQALHEMKEESENESVD